MKRAGWLLLVMGMALWAIRPGVSEADWPIGGYVTNAGFEGTFYPDGEDLIADAWTRHNLSGSPDWMSTAIFAWGGHVERIEGENSHIISVDDLPIGQPYESVLYQQVGGLTAGQPYSFSGWILKMWGGSANQWPLPDPPTFVSWIGLDPTGGTDPNGATVIWSEADWQDGGPEWDNQLIAAVAQGPVMTLFVRLALTATRAESQIVIDAMELFDAPEATLQTAGGYVTDPTLHWSGSLPPMLLARGDYRLYFEVQHYDDGSGRWLTLATALPATQTSYTLPLAEGESMQVRVLPYSLQPVSTIWPPNTFNGIPTPPITVALDLGPPEAMLLPLSPWLPAAPFEVAWEGSDTGSGIANYEVQYRPLGTGAWRPWLTTSASRGVFGQNGEPETVRSGDEWEFRLRATDGAGNRGAWSNPLQVGIAAAKLSGRIQNAAGEPLHGVRLVAEPYPFSLPPTVDLLGNYTLPLVAPGSVTVTILDHRGVVRIPDTTVTVGGGGGVRNWYLPPHPNVVANGHFEQSDGWSGLWSATANSASGSRAARLAAGGAISQIVSVPGDALLTLAWQGEPGAELIVALGGREWRLLWSPAPVGSGGWNLWTVPAGSAGVATLTLTAEGGPLSVDQVGLGVPRPADLRFIPIARR